MHETLGLGSNARAAGPGEQCTSSWAWGAMHEQLGLGSNARTAGPGEQCTRRRAWGAMRTWAAGP